jgi:uncharacterized membrane protein
MKRRPFVIRAADQLTSYFGSLEFLFANGLLFVIWIVVNSGKVPGFVPFDPYPFTFLIMLVSLEAIFLTTIVLMSQNRQSFITSLRDELDMQVNILTEREITKALELLIALHRQLDLDEINDPELVSMLKATNISYIERKLEEQLKIEPPSVPKMMATPITKIAGSVMKSKPNGNGNTKPKS